MKKHLREEEHLALLSGRLRGLARWRAARHVAICFECQAEQRVLAQLGTVVREHYTAPVSGELEARLESIPRRNKPSFGGGKPIVRLPAPLVCAALGALLGFYQASQSRYEWEATTSVTVAAVTPKNVALVKPVFLAQRVHDQNILQVDSVDRLPGGQVRVGLKVWSKDEASSKEALAGWLEYLKNPAPVLGKWKVDTPVPTTQQRLDPRQQVLTYVVMGLVVGGIFSLLRLLAPLIPGGVAGCIVVGILAGVLVLVTQGAKLIPPAIVRHDLKITSKQPVFDDPYTESFLQRELIHQSVERLRLSWVYPFPYGDGLSVEARGSSARWCEMALGAVESHLSANETLRQRGYRFTVTRQTASTEPLKYQMSAWIGGVLVMTVTTLTLLLSRRK